MKPITSPHLTHPKYRADIDGLRAVAIISVIIFHAFPSATPGGFIGVDIFFIISGFLISTITFSSLERNAFSLVDFYVRRIKRIFPALIIVMICTLIFGWFFLFTDEYSQLGKHTAAGAGFIQNFAVWRESGYFDSAAEAKPLLHLWSLAVEEQFYIFWPLLLAFVWQRKWSFLKVTSTIAVISFVANIYLIRKDPTAAFFLPISRFWELMIGGALAYIASHYPTLLDKHKNIQSALGFSLIAAGLLFINKGRDFPGWWAFLPTIGAFFIISAGGSAYLNKHILSSKPMVWVGLISYPLYLWHWPVLSYIHIINDGKSSRLTLAAAILASTLLAWLTHKFVEQKIRDGIFRENITSFLSASMGLIFLIGCCIWYIKPDVRIDSPDVSRIHRLESNYTYPNGLSKTPDSPEYVYEINSAAKDTSLFIGDSHAFQYANKVIQLIETNPSLYNKVIFAVAGSCPPIPNVFTGWDEVGGLPSWANSKSCNDTKDFAHNLIHNNKNIKTLIISAAWNSYFHGLSKATSNPIYSNYYSIRDGARSPFINGNGSAVAMTNLEDFIQSIPKHIRVAIITDTPSGDEFTPKANLNGDRLTGFAPRSDKFTVAYDEAQKRVTRSLITLAERQGKEYYDPSSMFCANDRCHTVSSGGYSIYRDNNHLSSKYILDHAEFIDGLIARKSSSDAHSGLSE